MQKDRFYTEHQAIRRELRLIDWDELRQGDIDDQWEKFLTVVTESHSSNSTERLIPVPKTLRHIPLALKDKEIGNYANG